MTVEQALQVNKEDEIINDRGVPKRVQNR